LSACRAAFKAAKRFINHVGLLTGVIGVECRGVASCAFISRVSSRGRLMPPLPVVPSVPIVLPADVARKFLVLVERSRVHLRSLYESGRWRSYYSEDEFVTRLRDLTALREKWESVATVAGNGLPSLRRWGAKVPMSSTPAPPLAP
jgi:hypothetical protein